MPANSHSPTVAARTFETGVSRMRHTHARSATPTTNQHTAPASKLPWGSTRWSIPVLAGSVEADDADRDQDPERQGMPARTSDDVMQFGSAWLSVR